MLWPSRKKMTARKMANRNSLGPNEGGFRLAESVGFNELAMDLILTTSVDFGALCQGQNWGNIAYERIFPSRRASMDQHPNSFGAMVRLPSAFLPLAMSLTALALVLGRIAIFGVAREADEGTAAHLWQLLMAGQMPVLAYFAIKWLPRAPRQTLYILALQAGAALASVAPVFFLNW